jgi:hypothetical protein
MGRHTQVRRVAVSLLLVTATACGTTVDVKDVAGSGTGSGQQSPTGASSGGLTAPGAGSALGPATAGTGGATTGSTGSSAAGTGSGAGSGSTSGASGGGAQTSLTGPGITASTIFVGVAYSSQSAQGDRAIGAAGAAPSYDTRDVFNAVIDYANKHGGFAGRTLKALYYDFNLTTDTNVQEQSACSFWTQDHKVFSIPGSDDILRACAEKAGAVSTVSGATVASTYQKFPHFVEPYAVRLDRLGPMTVNGLYKAGYFTGKFGFVTWDDPNYRYAYDHGYLPALTSHGIKVVDKAFISVPQQIGALGDMSAAVSSAVTKFRSEGIDHVIIQDGHAGVWAGTGLTLEWMDQAKSQKYYPRYGQNARNSPGWDVLPSDQMDKAIAIMDSDFDARYDAGWHPNKQRELCFKIQAAAGYPVASSNLNDEGIAAQVCDRIFLLQYVINKLGTNLTSDAFMAEVAALGRTFPSAVVYGTQFAPGLRDGSAEVRQAEYFDSCKCLKYSGAPYYPS